MKYLQKKPPKLLKQLISELEYLDEPDIKIKLMHIQALLMNTNQEKLKAIYYSPCSRRKYFRRSSS